MTEHVLEISSSSTAGEEAVVEVEQLKASDGQYLSTTIDKQQEPTGDGDEQNPDQNEDIMDAELDSQKEQHRTCDVDAQKDRFEAMEQVVDKKQMVSFVSFSSLEDVIAAAVALPPGTAVESTAPEENVPPVVHVEPATPVTNIIKPIPSDDMYESSASPVLRRPANQNKTAPDSIAKTQNSVEISLTHSLSDQRIPSAAAFIAMEVDPQLVNQQQQQQQQQLSPTFQQYSSDTESFLLRQKVLEQAKLLSQLSSHIERFRNENKILGDRYAHLQENSDLCASELERLREASITMETEVAIKVDVFIHRLLFHFY